jgi:hypothetical protein
MKKFLSAVIAALALMSFTAAAFPANTKPVVPGGPIYATIPVDESQNDAVNAVKAKEAADAKDAKARAEIKDKEAKDVKEKFDANAVKAKARAKSDADAEEAKDAANPAYMRIK